MDAPPVEVRALWKRYGDVAAVRGVDVAPGRGEVVGLVGPNGAGKTTLLKMLAGLVRPTAGTVRVLGLDPCEPEGRARIGFLPETSPVYEDLTPDEYLRLFAGLYGLDRRAGYARADELLSRFGLDVTDRPLGTLSKGMRRKVALARTLLHAPDVLLLDEAASGLDPGVVHTVLDALRAEAAAGRTVLFSAHNLAHVEAVSDHVLVMHAGRVVMDGSMDDVRAVVPPTAYRVSLSGPLAGATPTGGAFVAHADTFDDARRLMDAAGAAGLSVLDVRAVEAPLGALFAGLAARHAEGVA